MIGADIIKTIGRKYLTLTIEMVSIVSQNNKGNWTKICNRKK